MSITAEEKARVMKEFATKEGDNLEAFEMIEVKRTLEG